MNVVAIMSVWENGIWVMRMKMPAFFIRAHKFWYSPLTQHIPLGIKNTKKRLSPLTKHIPLENKNTKKRLLPLTQLIPRGIEKTKKKNSLSPLTQLIPFGLEEKVKVVASYEAHSTWN